MWQKWRWVFHVAEIAADIRWINRYTPLALANTAIFLTDGLGFTAGHSPRWRYINPNIPPMTARILQVISKAFVRILLWPIFLNRRSFTEATAVRDYNSKPYPSFRLAQKFLTEFLPRVE